MKLLTLIRHAKSSWKDPTLEDFDRPLNRRGLRNAPQMANRLSDRLPTPDRVLSSPARRASHTAQILAEHLRIADRLESDPRLYEAAPDEILAVLRDTPAHVNHQFLVGHNPGITACAESLTGQGLEDLPTCAVAHIRIDLDDWHSAAWGCGTLLWIDFPKNETGRPIEA